ncbi:DUF3108 domain-containing protein [Candidatus Aerophobetes bacterium]|nr:DUF3108 domain-containing protein [Candidatus Aerophobetes bacterium]
MREKEIKRIGLVLCFLLFFVISSGRVGAYSFKVGEKLIYTVKWSGTSLLLKVLPETVGKLVLEVKEKLTQTNGYLFSWELRTVGFFPSLLFPIDERRESYVDIDTFCPYKVTIYYKEGKYLLKDWVIEIDQKTGEALIRDKKNGQEETRLLSLPVFDIPSLIYWLRTQELEVGNVFPPFFLLEDERLKGWKEKVEREVRIKVTRKEEIDIYDEPCLTFLCKEVGLGKIKVWFSADERYLPVKIEVDVGEGTLIASLDLGKSIF